MKLDLIDYILPEGLIAFHPSKERDGSRLLVLSPDTEETDHRQIMDLPDLLPDRAVLVANDTRVVRARLNGRRPTGGAVEVLLVREVKAGETACRWKALTRANKRISVGDRIILDGISVQIIEKGDRGEATVEIDASSETLREHMAVSGEVPLPPYIRRAPVAEDVERYQTVYARHDGSVAAPTAGLHFTDALIERIAARGVEMVYVTLHVGPGTFRPISAVDTDEHSMDEEEYVLSEDTASTIRAAKDEGRPIIAVGTTVTRALEGAFAQQGALEACSGFTDIFITPGFKFRVVDGLITNFHLPRSTLLCLVSALAGRERVLAAYNQAVEKQYRFYSYGDAMFILPKKT
ncbi:MAG: tRNA preQ1(34) S-adenosylmethionine ribosyltransferase-isomerase QueA [Deltaproteobacteria bacterium]|nr:tRNA preQ1(34) S-adenosylmethionine ribosyltransferase-isomerase QueA [Deltaproteobacteria bacterium]